MRMIIAQLIFSIHVLIVNFLQIFLFFHVLILEFFLNYHLGFYPKLLFILFMHLKLQILIHFYIVHLFNHIINLVLFIIFSSNDSNFYFLPIIFQLITLILLFISTIPFFLVNLKFITLLILWFLFPSLPHFLRNLKFYYQNLYSKFISIPQYGAYVILKFLMRANNHFESLNEFFLQHF